MVCDINSIDSNFTGMRICEEICPKELDPTPANQKWFVLEPNSYSNLGGNNKTVAREPINKSRQDKRGSVVDVESAAAWNEDFTQNNMIRRLQGFFFNNAYEKYNLLPLNGTPNPALTVVVSTGVFTVTSTLATSIYAGDLVRTTGFTNSANNLFAKAVTVTTTTLDTDATTTVAEVPPSTANIRVVGHEFDSGDLVATIVSNKLVLTSSVYAISKLGLRVGEWIFIGGDAVGTQFANGYGYARVYALTATTIVCDKSTGLITADAGVGKTIRIFTGTYIRNPLLAESQVVKTYHIERTLGEDANGTQAQVEIGSYANEFSLKMPSAAKLEADLSYVCMDEEFYDGTQIIPSEVVGVELFEALGEEAYNTSTDMVRVVMSSVQDSLSPDSLFAYLTEANINISNGAKLNKAVGVVGGISASYGNFKVSGSVTAYFQTIEAQRALRNNEDVTVDMIFAKSNAGFVYDIPFLGLGGGQVNVTKDEAITIPLEQFAAESPAGYTLSYTNLNYLPTVAMPV